MRAISASDKRNSSANRNSPGDGSQGGIKRLRVTAAIWRACDFASLYVSSGKGAASPKRWHCAHERKKMGAISRLNVTCGLVFEGGVALRPAEAKVAFSCRAFTTATTPSQAINAKYASLRRLNFCDKKLIPGPRCSSPPQVLPARSSIFH